MLAVRYCRMELKIQLDMNNHFSILHISDLHKGENNDFDHLFASMCNDADSYDREMPRPEIIVISGDLAEGAEGDDAEEIIRKQYDEVESFLNKLVYHFLKGDKSRIIIVPGNHDLFRGATKKSMEPVPEEVKEAAKERYFKSDPKYRWSWHDFQFYYIKDNKEYAARFRYFIEFYNRFYEGIRQLDDCDMMNLVIDLPDYNLSFATFNSCYRIDHLNQIGAINTSAIAASQPQLSRAFKHGRFILGVWHHNISGIPTQMNYLDPRILHSLMDFHIQLGLYGHQHHAEALYEYHDIFKQGKMTLVSSGCLYGRGKTMPEGTHCQYNILEISQTKGKAVVILHVREDETAWEIPSWRKKQIDGKDSYLMEFLLPQIDYQRVLADTVDLAKSSGDYKSAIVSLLSIRENEHKADKFIDEFLPKLTSQEICELNFTPKTVSQVVSILGACVESHDWTFFDKTLFVAETQGLRNLQMNVIIEEANKIR